MQDCIVNQFNSHLDFSLSWRNVKTFPCCFPISNGTVLLVLSVEEEKSCFNKDKGLSNYGSGDICVYSAAAMQLRILCGLVFCTLLLTVGWGEVGIEVKDIMFLYQGILVPCGETAVSSLKIGFMHRVRFVMRCQ